MVRARFMSHSGKFRIIKEETFPTSNAALDAAKAHYEPLGFTNLQIVDDAEYSELRITAKTPGGRGGRNIVFLDWMVE